MGATKKTQSSEPCEFVHDGFDTDGTEWFLCTTHSELSVSDWGYCAGYIEITYNGKESEA